MYSMLLFLFTIVMRYELFKVISLFVTSIIAFLQFMLEIFRRNFSKYCHATSIVYVFEHRFWPGRLLFIVSAVGSSQWFGLLFCTLLDTTWWDFRCSGHLEKITGLWISIHLTKVLILDPASWYLLPTTSAVLQQWPHMLSCLKYFVGLTSRAPEWIWTETTVILS